MSKFNPNPKISKILGQTEEDIEQYTSYNQGNILISQYQKREIVPSLNEEGKINEDDIEEKLNTSELKMDEISSIMLDMGRKLLDDVDSIEPRLRARNIEVANETFRVALDAVKSVAGIQEKKRDQRIKIYTSMKEEDNNGGSLTIISGTHMDILNALEQSKQDIIIDGDIEGD